MSFSLTNLFRTKHSILDLSGDYARVVSATRYRDGTLATFTAQTFTSKDIFSYEGLSTLVREHKIPRPTTVVIPELFVETQMVTVAKAPLTKHITPEEFILQHIRHGAFLKEYADSFALCATRISESDREYRATVLLVPVQTVELIKKVFGAVEIVCASMSLARLLSRDTLDHFLLSDTRGGAFIAYVRRGSVVRTVCVEGNFGDSGSNTLFLDMVAHSYRDQLALLYRDGITTHDEVRVALFGAPAQIENADSFLRVSFALPAQSVNPWQNIILPSGSLPPLPLSDSYRYATVLGMLAS